MKKNVVIVIAIVILFALGLWWGIYASSHQPPVIVADQKTVTYNCDASKSITATYDLSVGGGVALDLSDGRSLTLPHAISADGARYANSDESFVFWNKGNTAFITEGTGTKSTETYQNCVEQVPVDISANATTTYKNDQFGFQIEYPNTLMATTTFGTSYVLRTAWRSEAGPDSTGTAVVAIPVFRIDQGGVATGKSYPLKFDAEVHIGVSSDPTDVANCLKPDAGYTNEPEADVMIGGVPFKEFSFQDDAMMTYLQGNSYRAVHNGMCYAVEQIKTGSDYRDDTMTAGISDAQLTAYYDEAGAIAQTFQFTR